MADTFPISQSVLKWVEQTININELPEKMKKQFSSWKNKDSEPTYAQLKEFSKKTRIPFGYLFRTDPPKEEMSMVEFRTPGSHILEHPSRELLDTYTDMKIIQDWMEETLENSDHEPLPFIGSMHNENRVSLIVEKARKLLDLRPDDWLKAHDARTFSILRNRISSLGIVVMQNGITRANSRRVLDLQEFRGFALMNSYAPLIFINSTDSNAGKVFTLLHEFIHLLLGSSDLFTKESGQQSPDNSLEKTANAAAAELILPTSLFLKFWNEEYSSRNGYEKVKSLSDRLQCSSILIARKAQDHQLISKSEYLRISAETGIKHKKKKAGGGGDYYRAQASRQDPGFLSALHNSVLEGTTSYTDAFRMTNTTNRTFFGVVEAALQKEQTCQSF